jgi:hypothetical protein
MENKKWLKRKYPDSFTEIVEFLNDKELENFKRNKYKLGRLVKPVWYVNLYPTNTLIMFKRSNPIYDVNYPLHYAVVKCEDNLTESGYHSINLFEQDFEEIRS